MMHDQAAALRSMTQRSFAFATTHSPSEKGELCHRVSTIAVTSGKGGVGKTNIALMLSLALSALRQRVLLFDADLGLANVHILLGLSPHVTLRHVVEGQCSVEEAVCKGPGGIDIVPGASGITALANIDALHLEILRRELSAFEQRYDRMIVDTSAGIGSIATEFAMHADMALCVMTPEPTSLADVYAMLKVLAENSSARLYVVVNMAASDNEGYESFERLRALCRRFLQKEITLAGILPVDRDLPRLIRRQRIIFIENPKSMFSVRIGAIARKLIGIGQTKKEGFFERLFSKAGNSSKR